MVNLCETSGPHAITDAEEEISSDKKSYDSIHDNWKDQRVIFEQKSCDDFGGKSDDIVWINNDIERRIDGLLKRNKSEEVRRQYFLTGYFAITNIRKRREKTHTQNKTKAQKREKQRKKKPTGIQTYQFVTSQHRSLSVRVSYQCNPHKITK